LGKVNWAWVLKTSGWKTTLLTSVFFVQISVFLAFSPHGTILMVLIRMSVHRCSQMLDGLVSSHPFKTYVQN
jgi:hypothetical protein